MTASKRRFLWWSTALLATLAATTLWTAGRAADKGNESPKAAKSELDVIPSDGLAAISFHLAELWNDESFKSAREKMTKEDPDILKGFVKQVGVAPDEIERVTGVIQSMESGENWLGFITTAKPYNAKKVLAAAAPDAKEEKIKGRAFYANTKGYSVAVLTDRTYVIGAAEEVKRYLNHPGEGKEGPLTPALRAAEKHCIAAGVNVPLVVRP